MNPFPTAVASDLSDDRDAGRVELGTGCVNVVDLEKRNGSACMIGEELEIRVSGSHQLNLVTVGCHELHRRGVIEVHAQPHNVLEQFSHLSVVLGRNADPADVAHLHAHPLPESAGP